MSEHSAALLDGLFRWPKANIKPLAIGLFILVAIFFLVKGISGLLGWLV